MIIKVESIKFKVIADMMKSLKSNIVYTDGNIIYGVNESMKVLKTIILNESIPFTFTCLNKDLQSFTKSITDSYVMIDYIKGVIYCENNINNMVYIHIDVNGSRMVARINMLYHDIYNQMSPVKPITYLNIRTDSLFENALALKSEDGVMLYRKDDYIMSIFNGLLPINKADKVDLMVYDYSESMIISNFIIHKKGYDINIFIRYLKLI